jgi:hypothetical protein
MNLPANDLDRQRWGCLSVEGHINAADLVTDILLYDRVVLPIPDTDAEWERWTKAGWDPGLTEYRQIQLADVAHFVPWRAELREQWADQFSRLKAMGIATRGAAYGMTSVVLSGQAWRELQPAEDQERPMAPPELVAAYRSEGEAFADFAVVTDMAPERPGERPFDREVAALIRRTIHLPDLGSADDEHPLDVEAEAEALASAVRLSGSDAYRRARRALFAFEDRVAREQWRVEDALVYLEAKVAEHDELVRQERWRTRARNYFRLLTWTAGPAVGIATGNPLIGAGAALSVQLVGARFPKLADRAPDLDDQPGAAINRISAMYPKDPERSGRD